MDVEIQEIGILSEQAFACVPTGVHWICRCIRRRLRCVPSSKCPSRLSDKAQPWLLGVVLRGTSSWSYRSRRQTTTFPQRVFRLSRLQLQPLVNFLLLLLSSLYAPPLASLLFPHSHFLHFLSSPLRLYFSSPCVTWWCSVAGIKFNLISSTRSMWTFLLMTDWYVGM